MARVAELALCPRRAALAHEYLRFLEHLPREQQVCPGTSRLGLQPGEPSPLSHLRRLVGHFGVAEKRLYPRSLVDDVGVAAM